MKIEELRAKLNGSSSSGKPQQRHEQKEGKLQIACVRWFRLQYPAFANLLFHPKNEADGATSGKKIAINAAQGVVPGVPDLILSLPSMREGKIGITAESPALFYGLGIELKFGKTNNQSAKQKNFQMYWEEAGYKYALCRSLEDFMAVVKEYMLSVPPSISDSIIALHSLDPDTEANKKLLSKLIKKNK